MKIKYTILILLLALIACEKEIEIDYNTIEPIDVVEAIMGNDYNEVRISTTRDMTDSVKSTTLTTAIIVVKDDTGNMYSYTPNESGVYKPFTPFSIHVGNTYTLDVELDGSSYTANAYIHETPAIAAINITEEEFMPGMNMVFCSLLIDDTPDCNNYYRYRIRVNSQEEDWSLTNDSGQDGLPITTIPMPLFKELAEGEKDNTGMGMNMIEDGDTVIIDLQSVDRGIYDYFFSLSLSSSNGSNPTSNIDGGCLGYFAAYSLTSDTLIYYSSIEEEL